MRPRLSVKQRRRPSVLLRARPCVAYTTCTRISQLEGTMISDSLIYLVNVFAYLFFWIVVLRVVLSWLIGFNVVNGYNPYVRMFQRFSDSVTEPLLGPIRRALPDLGGLDISPLLLLIALEVVRRLLVGLLSGQPLF